MKNFNEGLIEKLVAFFNENKCDLLLGDQKKNGAFAQKESATEFMRDTFKLHEVWFRTNSPAPEIFYKSDLYQWDARPALVENTVVMDFLSLEARITFNAVGEDMIGDYSIKEVISSLIEIRKRFRKNLEVEKEVSSKYFLYFTLAFLKKMNISGGGSRRFRCMQETFKVLKTVVESLSEDVKILAFAYDTFLLKVGREGLDLESFSEEFKEKYPFIVSKNQTSIVSKDDSFGKIGEYIGFSVRGDKWINEKHSNFKKNLEKDENFFLERFSPES